MIYLLQQIIEQAAVKSPHAPAFRYATKSISYRELNDLSDKLASCLLDCGVCRGDRVAIYLNKSLECATAIYGILKAGAAYVPLDPGAPSERLGLILQDCNIGCLITHDPKRAGVEALVSQPDSHLTSIIGLSEPLDCTAQQHSWRSVNAIMPKAPDCSGRTSDDAAYIMYTSGSTGFPKGIVHSHGSGLSYAMMAADLYELTADDRLSNLPPLHFDQSIFDYFSGAIAGACTVIIPEAYAKLPASLSALIERERLTIWYSVPYALIQLLLHGVLHERNLRSLRNILFGGEPFPSKHLASLMELWPHARFCNVYGPAEVNQCTFHFLPHSWRSDTTPAPIGQVCPNAELLVVDEHDSPVSPGEQGQLIIRTPTAMRGYFNRPELNEGAFFQRHNEDGTLDRFYRSGDVVMLREDGILEFIGRQDRQIKVRGFRVELDEVEAVMTEHSSVEEAAAIAAGPSGETRCIEVTVTQTHGQGCSAEQLRQYAAKRLPQYAMPETIAIVSEFPRTTTGKIDRNKLAESSRQEAADRELAL